MPQTYAEKTTEMIEIIKKQYEKNGGGSLAIHEIFDGAKTVTEVIQRMEARAEKHEKERQPKTSSAAFLPILSIASLFFSSKKSASEQTLDDLSRMEHVSPPKNPGEKGKIEKVDMIAEWKQKDAEQQPKSASASNKPKL